MLIHLTKRFEEALVFASHVHTGHLRKKTEIPYIAHLLSVAAIVLEHGGGENEAIAALLHDAVEDRGVGVDDISARFGPEVASIVKGCTDSFEKDPKNKLPYSARKKAYLERLPTESRSALTVSAADKLHNARAILEDYYAIGSKIWARFNGSNEEILWYYSSLVSIFKRVDCPQRLVDELERVVAELIQLSDAEQVERKGSSLP
jgi:(p)ppGpp synthase/HD superfamily hydrolase